MSGCRLSGAARVAGVIGWPVTHSLSPRLHNHWLETYGIDGAYVPLAVRPEHLTEAVRALPKLGFVGANVTIPNKIAVCGALDRIEPEAERIGAVNTIIIGEDGGLTGSNTDGFGFLESIRAALPDWSPQPEPAVMLGAGGAARAVLSALLDAGIAAVRLVNRSRERAEALAAPYGERVVLIDWDHRLAALDGTALLVNTTTLGMTGQPPLDLALDRLPTDAVVVDIVYRPLITPLLAAAAARGNRVVDGLGMLFHQARPGFHAWFGVDPEVTPALRATVLGGVSAGR